MSQPASPASLFVENDTYICT